MSLANEIRALQEKLDAIAEAQQNYRINADGEMVREPDSDPEQGQAGQAASPAPAPAPSNEIPTIDAPNFNAAYAQAKKQGLKKFKWCGIYAVKDGGQAPMPTKKQPQGLAINSPTGDGRFVGGIGLPTDQPVYQPGA